MMRPGDFWRWLSAASPGDEYSIALVDGRSFVGRVVHIHDGRAYVKPAAGRRGGEPVYAIMLRSGELVVEESSRGGSRVGRIMSIDGPARSGRGSPA